MDNPEVSATIDYLIFRMPYTPEALAKLHEFIAPGQQFTTTKRNWLRHSTVEQAGSALVAHNSTWINADLKGRACQELAQIHQVTEPDDWRAVIATLTEMGAEFSRIDYALDMRGGEVDFGKILEAVEEGRLRSRSLKRNIRTEMRRSEYSSKALMIGSRKSNACVRIYDKALEQGEIGPWLRIECEYKKLAAVETAKEFVLRGFKAIQGDLAARVSFCEPSHDTNRSRWTVEPWWFNLLGGTPSKLIHCPRELSTAESAAANLVRLKKSFAVIWNSEEYGPYFFAAVLGTQQSPKEGSMTAGPVLASNFVAPDGQRAEVPLALSGVKSVPTRLQ